MVQKHSFKVILLILMTALFFLPSCETDILGGNGKVINNQKQFDLDLFEDNIVAGLYPLNISKTKSQKTKSHERKNAREAGSLSAFLS